MQTAKPTESMNVGPALEGRIAHLPSPTGRTNKRVRVREVRTVGPGADGSGGFQVIGTWLRSTGGEYRLGQYVQGMMGSRVVQVEPVDGDAVSR